MLRVRCIIIIMRIPALKCSSSMLRPQLRLCRMAWVRGEGRESNKATNIYEIGHNNMKRTNLHMHYCTRMETTKYNGYNHCATKSVHRRSDDNVTKHKTQLLNTGSTKLQENNTTTLELPLNYRKCRERVQYKWKPWADCPEVILGTNCTTWL